MPDTIKTSTFTTFAIQKYADWYDNPQLAKTFVRVGFGTLTPEEQSADIYANPTQTQMHAETHAGDPDAAVVYFGPDAIAVSSEGPDTNVAYVRITAEFSAPIPETPDPYESIRGKTVREIGLYIDISEDPTTTNYQLMWLGKIDGVDIPDPEETARLVSINATIPVKFVVDTDIPATISTDNGTLAERIAGLESKTTGFRVVTLTPGDLEPEPGWDIVGSDQYWSSEISGLKMQYRGSAGPSSVSEYSYFRITPNGSMSTLKMPSPHFSLDLIMEFPPVRMVMTGNTMTSPAELSGAGYVNQYNSSGNLAIWFRLRHLRNSISLEEKWEGCVIIRYIASQAGADDVRAHGYIILD